MSMLGGAVFHLPQPIARDGFVARDLVFVNSAFGLLLDGEVAKDLAVKYHLKPEGFNLLGASQGYSRPLPKEEQVEGGMISIVARQSDAMPGKTFLMCEFVTDADRAALRRMKGSGM